MLVHAVLGMLPKNKLRDDIVGRLKVYPDEVHPYTNEVGLYAPPTPPIDWGTKWVRAQANPERHRGYFIDIKPVSEGLQFTAKKGKGFKLFKERRQPAWNFEERRRKKIKYEYLRFPWEIPGKEDASLVDVFCNTDMTDEKVQASIPNFVWPPPDPEKLPVGTQRTRPIRPPRPTYAKLFGAHLKGGQEEKPKPDAKGKPATGAAEPKKEAAKSGGDQKKPATPPPKK